MTQAVAKLMKQAGVNFGILGEEEMCCGDPARRLGAEHLFQMLAMNNIQLLSSYNIKKIVTACPHCFNTLKNEYPQMSGRFEVIHHSQFIADLIRENKPCVKGIEEALGLAQPNISQHLSLLRNIGIVEAEREGNQVCYRIKNPIVLKLLDALCD